MGAIRGPVLSRERAGALPSLTRGRWADRVDGTEEEERGDSGGVEGGGRGAAESGFFDDETGLFE
jgi:hypothetical protein